MNANFKKRRNDFLVGILFDKLAMKHQELDKKKSEKEYEKRVAAMNDTVRSGLNNSTRKLLPDNKI